MHKKKEPMFKGSEEGQNDSTMLGAMLWEEGFTESFAENMG